MAIVLTAALVLPFTAHTVTELEQWQADWNDRAMHSLDVGMMDERRDMRSRHSWYFDPQPEEVMAPVGTLRTTSVTTPPPTTAGVEQWRTLVAAYFPADQVDRALRVMACESGGDPNAYNPSGASGLMQVLSSWADNFGYRPADLFDPAINLRVARYLWDDGEARVGNGWVHWVCRG